MGERARAGSSNHAAVVAGARVCSGRRRLPHRGRARLNRRRVGRGLHCSWSRENGERAGREVLPVSHAVINKLGGRREGRRRGRRKKLKSFTIRHFHSGNKQESVGSTQREARKEGFSTIRSPTLAGSKRRIERGGLSFFSLCGRRWPTSNLRLPKTLASSGSPTFSKVEACLPERASPRSRSRARCQNLILGLRHELSEKKREE